MTNLPNGSDINQTTNASITAQQTEQNSKALTARFDRLEVERKAELKEWKSNHADVKAQLHAMKQTDKQAEIERLGEQLAQSIREGENKDKEIVEWKQKAMQGEAYRMKYIPVHDKLRRRALLDYARNAVVVEIGHEEAYILSAVNRSISEEREQLHSIVEYVSLREAWWTNPEDDELHVLEGG
ncbi:hypothetical protein BJ508DRAFT_328077 [Ascobolus immersus RN42]|uniref:Uncharacterized protein n=1 Tax=Ascobolus immersus RN42 TaxID=1160509 RepID=A0A3N4I2K9_ASCIM|nr:hypothetical protein BJ508DRAFT_328077 [Ascobolus immersus RN42]